ncbi:MAG: SelT/SelW/SelH family protein [Chloroflexi bacterium]|nr:SelT/SelW/SelH family protein [Chloroflexota bacterium]
MASPRVEIRYCTQCRFMLRAAYLAQELLTSFEKELGEVALVPSSGGIFEVTLDGETLATNRETKRLPEAGEVKRLLRDRIAPGRTIGHE